MTEYQLLSGAQIIAFNPILQAHPKVKNSVGVVQFVNEYLLAFFPIAHIFSPR